VDKAVALGIFTKTGNKIKLTSAGREVAVYAEKAISLFMRYILSERTSTFLTFILHVVLSFLKALFGLLSFSAGLLADAADNTMDTLAAAAKNHKYRFPYNHPIRIQTPPGRVYRIRDNKKDG
jgi:hypothetical protein